MFLKRAGYDFKVFLFAAIDFFLFWVYNANIEIEKAKTGESPFLLFFEKNMKKIIQKTTKKAQQLSKKAKNGIFTLGNVDPSKGRILLLIVAIIFATTGAIVSNLAYKEEPIPVRVQINSHIAKIESPFDRKVTQLVEGYPIAEMTPYILSKDPRVAAFMIAIAKKESAWGKRHPVLDGRNCYNYWGFRLKTSSMGSGGHTCFDTPEQAVDMVASRIDEMVNEENMNSPTDMIIWKCGYGCQDSIKTVSEKKWISDVDMYYSKLKDYL